MIEYHNLISYLASIRVSYHVDYKRFLEKI